MVLCFDFGTTAIGVAAGSGGAAGQRPEELPALAARDGRPEWRVVDALVAAWQPRLLVVGLPLHADGSDSPIAARARRFARQLGGRLQLPWRMMDERLSTVAAREELAVVGTAGRARSVHSVAARLVLEAYFRSPESAGQ